MADCTAAFDQVDLDRCIHCGLCLNVCPTYRELGIEMDSPRGRIYQMVHVASGGASGEPYAHHIGLCLACRACESACPSGVPYGRLVEAAREDLEERTKRPWHARLFRGVLLNRLFDSPWMLRIAGRLLWAYEATGMRELVETSGLLSELGPIGRLAPLAPSAEPPFFYREIGRTIPAEGKRRYRVAFLSGCIANVCFARLNEATVRVLVKNGCEVVIPGGQTCCGALHVHIGLKEKARQLARQNIDTMSGDYDAIITNAAGCGTTLKEYGHLLSDDQAYRDRAIRFAGLLRDVNEFLGSIELTTPRELPLTVTYQDSCHLAHGQRIRSAPRKLLAAIPGLRFREMPLSDLCCGSAGIYNLVHEEMADSILRKKMEAVNSTGAGVIATANPGCIIQLRAGAKRYGRGQRVAHVIELLDEAYR